MTTALFVEIVDVLVSAEKPTQLLPGVSAAIKRLQQRGVPIIAISDRVDENDVAAYVEQLRSTIATDAAPLTDIVIATPSSPASWRKPRPGLLLSSARAHHINLPESWFIGTNADDALAAGQAGCAGVVIVGGGLVPPNDIGIVVAEARDLSDAPRVMIPRGGGCWHQM